MKLKLLIVALFCSVVGWGQSIFTNPLTFTSAVQASPYTAGQTVDPNITVSGIARGSGIAGAAAAKAVAHSDMATDPSTKVRLKELRTIIIAPCRR